MIDWVRVYIDGWCALGHSNTHNWIVENAQIFSRCIRGVYYLRICRSSQHRKLRNVWRRTSRPAQMIAQEVTSRIFLQKSLKHPPGIELGTCRVTDETLNHYTNCVQLVRWAANFLNKFWVASLWRDKAGVQTRVDATFFILSKLLFFLVLYES